MKKIAIVFALLVFALLFVSSPVLAAEKYTMTGVMAVYPGTVNEPFSAPIVNPKEYAKKSDCEDAITEIASAHPILVMINNGNVLEPQKTAGGYVAVAASCN